MSDTARTAPGAPLGGAAFTGLIEITEVPPPGMVTLRCDLAQVQAAEGVIGAPIPGQRGVTHSARGAVLWMSPDELLLMCPYAEADDLTGALAQALSGTHHLAVTVSDARAMFTLRGAAVRDVLAKLTPADLRPKSLPETEIRRTRLAQVPAAFWFSDAQTAHLICFRSVAQYVYDLLCTAADPEAALTPQKA